MPGNLKIIQAVLPFRSHPLLAEEKISRLSLGGLAVNLSEQIMQPLAVTPFQEDAAPAFMAPTLESSPPQTRDPEEDLLCIAKTFSYLRESGKNQRQNCHPLEIACASYVLQLQIARNWYFASIKVVKR